MSNITPQGYNYGVEPNTNHPFWNGEQPTPETGLVFYPFDVGVEKTAFDCNTKYHVVMLECDGDTIGVTVPLVDVNIETNLLLPFMYNNHVAYLQGDGTSIQALNFMGVWSVEPVTVTITEISELIAPIKGEKGDTGAQGERGLKGDKGDTGAQGIQGEKGEKGDTGAQGEKGEKGDTGAQGIQGVQGIQGEKGEKGDTGAQGIQGEKGEKGDTGAQGIQGVQGIQGEKGEKGEKGDNGVTPIITATAQIIATGGDPSVTVQATGTPENENLEFIFNNIGGGSGGLSMELLSTGTTLDDIYNSLVNVGDFVLIPTANIYLKNPDLFNMNNFGKPFILNGGQTTENVDKNNIRNMTYSVNNLMIVKGKSTRTIYPKVILCSGEILSVEINYKGRTSANEYSFISNTKISGKTEFRENVTSGYYVNCYPETPNTFTYYDPSTSTESLILPALSNGVGNFTAGIQLSGEAIAYRG